MPATAAVTLAAAIQVLFFTKSSGHEHPVIRETDGQPSLATRVLQQLGRDQGFEVTTSKDGALFAGDGLASFDVLVFYTSGDLTTVGKDGAAPMTPGGKELLLEAVRNGKGFVGIHSGADTFHSPADRFTADGDGTDPYLKMLGGEFIAHGGQQTGRLHCADPKFPGLAAHAAPFDLHEEWYSYKNLSSDLHVVQWVASWSLKNTGRDSVYRRPPYPITWARRHGEGRVFYTGLGHREDVWEKPFFKDMLAGAIRWAARRVDAAIPPDVVQVTPGFDQLPPRDATPTPRPTPVEPVAPAPAP